MTTGGRHAVYVVRCADDTLYTGYTTDLERRVAEHDRGKGAAYTRGRTPVELVHAEYFESRSAAMSREAEIKSLSKREKEGLLSGPPEVFAPVRDHLPRDDHLAIRTCRECATPDAAVTCGACSSPHRCDF